MRAVPGVAGGRGFAGDFEAVMPLFSAYAAPVRTQQRLLTHARTLRERLLSAICSFCQHPRKGGVAVPIQWRGN